MLMNSSDFSCLIRFLSLKMYKTLSVDFFPDIYLFYGPSWIPVFPYVMKFLCNSEEEEDVSTLKETIKSLVNSARQWSDNCGTMKEEQHILRILLLDFVPQVQKFFEVPTKMPSVQLNQNETLAAFLSFLLQIWSTEANRDGNNSVFIHENKNYARVHKELTHVLTFLGDVPFQCCTYNQFPKEKDLSYLLAEFETVANHAGSLTFGCILATCPGRFAEFDKGIDSLMHRIKLLNDNIRQYCITFSERPVYSTARVFCPIDSLVILDSLLEDIKNIINRRFQVTVDYDLSDHIDALYKELKLLRVFLKDLHREKMNDVIKEYLIMTREMSFEAEYLINAHVVGNIPAWYLKLRIPDVIQNLERNRSRIQNIKTDDEVLQVAEDFISLQHVETTTTVGGDHLVGIEESKTEILDKLTGGSRSLKFISLIGMPGLGKTTLAKVIFDSLSVRIHFDRRAWCAISQNYVKREVFVKILMSLNKRCGGEEILGMDDEMLGVLIHKSLKRNRYLIIIDDIWIPKTWDDIRRYFPDDGSGSRIIFTSRNKDAIPKEGIVHTLPLLSDADCVDLIVKKVFFNGPCPRELLSIVERIAKKCHGLPLSVVAISGVLTNLQTLESVWKSVELNLDSFLLDDPHGCLRVLEFSYEHLPDRLKLCYLYLGTYPEDAEISAQKLVRLWIAEGFIGDEGEKSAEDVANKYIWNLVNRSLVFIANKTLDNNIKTCGVHDLLRDMCQRKSDEQYIIKSTKEQFLTYARYRRLRMDYVLQPLSSHFGLHCRSFSGHLLVETSCFLLMPLHRVIDLLPHFDMYGKELGGIDMLFHLRYLSTPSQVLLSQSTSNLVNLEFLDVKTFSGFEDGILLSIILNMVKLKHLKIREGARIINDCDNSQITNIQSLSRIRITDPEDEKVFKYCPHLQKLNYMCSMTIVPCVVSLTKLETLVLKFGIELENTDLTRVIFPSSIKSLTLESKIRLSSDVMSKIGELPNLDFLKLYDCAFEEDEWETICGEFEKLRFLTLDTVNLEQWITCSEHFPELQCLVFYYCEKLHDIPSDFGDITTLQDITVEHCSYMLTKSAVLIEEAQHKNGNIELQVRYVNLRLPKESLLYEQLKEAFSNFEAGHITRDELGREMRSVSGRNPSDSEIQDMIDEVDKSLSFSDYFNLIERTKIPYSEEELHNAFQCFDFRSNGHICPRDLIYWLTDEVSWMEADEESDDIFSEGYIDVDGDLDYDGFKKLMMTTDIPRHNDIRNALLTLGRKDDDDEGDDYDYNDDYIDLTGHVPTIHFSHPHPLQPILIHQIPNNICCSGCRHKSSTTMYTCQPCKFILHQSCAKLPETIKLPCHVGCTLSLLFVSSYYGNKFRCDVCKRTGRGWFYHCKSCEYDMHVSCASKQLKIKHDTCKLGDAILCEKIQLNQTKCAQIGSSSSNDVAESDQLGVIDDNTTLCT